MSQIFKNTVISDKANQLIDLKINDAQKTRTNIKINKKFNSTLTNMISH